jgi:hypothetical protein
MDALLLHKSDNEREEKLRQKFGAALGLLLELESVFIEECRTLYFFLFVTRQAKSF